MTVLGLLVASPPTYATGWRVSGPSRPAAGETATYVLGGPRSSEYRLLVFAGARACPPSFQSGDPAQTQDANGFLDDAGADSRQLSLSRGRSTICAYDGDGLGVAGRVVRTKPGRDNLRLQITKQPGYSSDAVVTATGYVGRDGGTVFAEAADQHIGMVTAIAVAPSAHCPRSPPGESATGTNTAGVGVARFSVDVTITDAFTLARIPRFCAYLQARRRVLGDLRQHIVARAQARAAPDADSGRGEAGEGDAAAALGAAVALLLLFMTSIVVLVRRARRPGEASPGGLAGAEPAALPHGQQPADVLAAATELEFVQRRRNEEAGFAIQRAVGMTADAFRDRLRVILEHQDGPDWLDAFNNRRAAAMLASGRPQPERYTVFEPRAVLICLAYDPAAQQLIDLNAVQAARKLSGLANAAHHPDPDNPLTIVDYQRAWHLYTEITGYAAPFDPYAG